MAARTGASVGVAVTITILGLVSVALFVTTMVFYGRSQSAQNQLNLAREDYAQFVSDAQREHASVRAVLEESRQARQSVVEYLMTGRADMLRSVTGDQSMTLPAFKETLAGIEGAESTPLVGLIENKNAEIARLTQRAEIAEQERRAAQLAAENEAERVGDIEASFGAQGTALQTNVSDIMNQLVETRRRLTEMEDKYAGIIDEKDSTHRSTVDEFETTVADLRTELVVLQDQLLRARSQGRTDIILPLNEEALVDGRIDRVDRAVNEVILSIGRKDKVVLGMTFAVYTSATDIRPNDDGEYPEGKAVLEIIRIEDAFSRARVVKSADGNPIIRGDVIANAVYDPTKTYKFVVEGLFDTNGDGLASRYERDELAALIERWGGTIVDEVTGDLDFLVLGERPVLPPPPSGTAPIAVINEYNRLQREINRYNDLQLSAETTSVPLLNANRLQTLIGDFPD